MATQILDSSDTEGILKDAGFEVVPPEPETNTVENNATENNNKTDDGIDPLDIEEEDGLTPRQKQEFTANMQKTIGKKHRMMKEAEEFAEEQYRERKLAEQRAQELEQRLQEIEQRLNGNQQPETKLPEEAKKPQRFNFATEEEYLDAMINYGVETRLKQEREAAQQRELQLQQERIIETAKDRVNKAAEIVPDFLDTINSAPKDAVIPPAVASYMYKSELFAELGYYLAKNPEIVLSLNKLEPDMQLVRIGKIESTLKPFGEKSPIESNNVTKTSTNSNTAPRETSTQRDQDTGITQSKNRVSAPVFQPINGSGLNADKPFEDMNIREAIADYSKRNRINLNVRKRH